MTNSPSFNSSTNSVSADEDTLFLNALEDERRSLKAVQNLRKDYIQRLEELSDESWFKNNGTDEANRLAKIDDIRKHLRDMESWDSHHIQRIAEGENLYREMRDLKGFSKAAQERQSAVKNEREQQALDKLIAKAFNPTCGWDRKHITELITLAWWPERSSWLFQLRNRMHMLMHRH